MSTAENRRVPYMPCSGNCIECDLPDCWLDNTEEDDFSMLCADDYRATAIKDALDDQTLKQKRKAAYQREYRAEHAEEIAAYLHQYWEDNKESLSAYKKRYRAEHRAAIATRDREYYQANRAAKLEYARSYREANREAINQNRREATARKRVAEAAFVANIQPQNARRRAPMLEVVQW